jgi:hypothetical protein
MDTWPVNFNVPIGTQVSLEEILNQLIKQGIYSSNSVPGKEKCVKYFSPLGRVEFYPKVGFSEGEE